MASMTIKNWTELVKRLKSVYTYPNFLVDSDSIKTWYYALCNYPLESVKAAVNIWIRDHKNVPTPADISELVNQISKGDKPKVDPFEHKTLWKIIDRSTGAIENDLYAPSDWSCDQVAGWLKARSVDLTGKVLKPIGG